MEDGGGREASRPHLSLDFLVPGPLDTFLIETNRCSPAKKHTVNIEPDYLRVTPKFVFLGVT